MGIVDYLMSKKQGLSYSKMMSGGIPVFSQFGQNIYASDVVQQCVHTITSELKKLQPMHVRKNGCDTMPVAGDVQRALDDPNELMTTADMLEKTAWILMLNYNAFVLPTFDRSNGGRRLTGLYPLLPSSVDFLQDGSGRYFVTLRFSNGYEGTVPYEDVVHIRHRYSVNEFMGGNAEGQADNGALLKTLELNDTLLQGVAKALKASFAVNGVVKYNTLMDKGKTDAAIAELEAAVKASESGFLPLDLKGEFVPLKRDVKIVDDKTLEFVDQKILRHFGVSLPILAGDFTVDQMAAFYQKTLEPVIASMAQAFTKGLFTRGERSRGNAVALYPEELVFMSSQQKIEMVNLLAPAGTLYENEKRTMFGMRPLPELSGVRMMSLNWVPVEYAREYQLNREKGAENGE